MKPASQREEGLFQAAVELAAAERATFLNGACHGDPALRLRLEALLAAHDAKDSFLEPETPKLSREPVQTIKLDLVDAPDEAVGQTLGRYKLLERVGEGGCGVVYVAEQTEPVRRRVALKVIKLGMDTKQVVARFEAERQALAMMDHPNIAKVLDAGTTDVGRPFFVMELVRGIKITDYCDQSQLSTKERLNLFIKVCQAIQHAHQKGIIHRDIKPSNILVTLHDGVPVPKVIDFGIAKATEGRLTDATVYTQLHQFIGTPAYMSPEQAEMSGLDIDTRSDIYSLGVLLYELLAGSTPFDAKELMASGIDAMRKTIREKEPVRPSTKLSQTLVAADVRRLKSPASDTPSSEEEVRASSRRLLRVKETITLLKGDLDWIVMKCLEKDRIRRYDTANGLAKDIERHLAHEPVTACPPGAWYRLRKTVRRNRLAFSAGTAIALALIIGFGASTWMFFRERSAQREQSRLRQSAERESRAALESARRLRQHSYAADMKLAHISVEENNVGRAAELLERWFPAPDEDDLRGIEWRYLWQASRSAALHVLSHDALVQSATLSPDGRLLATSSMDRQARVWDVATHTVVARFTGAAEMHGLAWSANGQFLAIGETNRFVVRETSGWHVVHEWPGATYYVAWSPDGRTVATARSGTLQLWDTVNWESTNILTNVGGLMWLAFSGDSRWLAVAHNSVIEVWDVFTRLRAHRFTELVRPISVALSPDNRWLAAGGVGGRLGLWDLETSRLLLLTNAHPSWVFGAAFSPDGKRLATGGGDQVIHFWETPTNNMATKLARVGTLKGHASEIWGLEFSRDGQMLASASKDSSARLWRAAPQPESDGLLHLAAPGAQVLGFSADSRALRTLKRDGSAIEEWSLRDGSLARSLSLPVKSAVPGDGAQLALLLKGDQAWVPLANGTLELWDLAANHRVQTLTVGNRVALPLQLSPDGRHIAVRDREGAQASLWNTQTGEREAAFPEFGATGAFRDFKVASFSPDNRLFAYAGSNYLVKIWDIAARRELHTLRGHVWHIYALTFSPDGQLLATSSMDGRVRLWRPATGEEAMPALSGHLGGVRVLHFTKDGRTLLAADDANTVRAWHVATGREMLKLTPRSPMPQSIASPDGRALFLYPPTSEGDLRITRLPSWAEINAAEAKEKTEIKQP